MQNLIIKLNERMRAKDRKQLKRYSIFIGVIWIIINIVLIFQRLMSPLWVVFNLFGLTIIWYLICIIVEIKEKELIEEENRKKKELFDSTKCLKVILTSELTNNIEINICTEIINFIELQIKKRFFDSLSKYTEYNCKKLLDEMIKQNKINFTAELIGEDIYISICYNNKNYPYALKIKSVSIFMNYFRLFN